MWRFKPFTHKEQNGLEGRAVDVGNLKIHVRNAIAEGGFSCVYLARDVVHPSKQYALKHIICNDEESLEIVMKEISVMKSLKEHPNVVTFYAHTIFDMGRTKEALLVMEFCEKSLVNVLESRGAGYFDEKQVFLIFRDVCNAVFAMHCQSPPIAHRDLKAENLLLGSDGLWKLCDFGSTSINHSRFERPEEMGIEEDNIRKYTTPAYRAPEMWDLYRRELINEKVDMWALGCLLFRICYFKSAFDGESKLQILNGNYRIPELPKYSSVMMDLIRDMLQSSPDARPDITQVWFRVNEQLPVNLQKSMPDRPPEMPSPDSPEGISKPGNKVSHVPRRSPPLPPSSSEPVKPSQPPSKGGAFWSTQHAKSSSLPDDNAVPKFDEESTSNRATKIDWSQLDNQTVPASRRNTQPQPHTSCAKDFEINFFKKDTDNGGERQKASKSEGPFQDEAFSTFVAEFNNAKLDSGKRSNKEDDALEAEVEKLMEELKQANSEKSEITSKYEKLSAICRSQRQEIQELKQALAARAPSPNSDAVKNQASRVESSSPTMQQERYGGNSSASPNTESKSWKAFPEELKPQQAPARDNSIRSVRTRSANQNKQGSEFDTWGFGAESFTATPASSSSQISRASREDGVVSQRFGESKTTTEGNSSASQPAGWAGF